ncbi:MAG: preprotein translocase subunit SecE [Gammaproteobacteria bacterium RIFCSPLOWO2_02_47_7]|jgi:preprotein translocase subunit SecE|nr:MAG: preprotein translocase subunit SecE [Gammaproteobacteria bacterium RIFCSPLOWO2_01_FULL_47_190]OGT64481.1 MAG: preprotein translocase subunit SecE [Gammaproteobacteria bacterium RIFCSPLOWO2_02_47_7]OGT74639.1 MAG: preprotein translocase subunit SecE [Gammaproteobacteria bacterium RIFCSPLOWO2_12_47_11]OGT83923.1 MAG: preprotein translocase subunit SecE [Gammaproteobacteria bacterium RIFCSPLOWO2_12_FULL_47_76]
MNSKVETAGSNRLDTIKIALSILIVASATTLFYLYSEHSLLLRVVGLLAAIVIAVLITLKTEKGRQLWIFVQDAQIEVRKVVWPTREETLQTTMIVILMVVVIAIFLWLLDMFLGWSIGQLLGRGG